MAKKRSRGHPRHGVFVWSKSTNDIQHWKGDQVHKIRIGYAGQVEVNKVLEPYNLTSNVYEMSVFKLDEPEHEYNAYISYFRLLKHRVSKNTVVLFLLRYEVV